MYEPKIGDIVDLPFNEKGKLVKILDLPWGDKYVIRMKKVNKTLNDYKVNSHQRFLLQQIKYAWCEEGEHDLKCIYKGGLNGSTYECRNCNYVEIPF